MPKNILIVDDLQSRHDGFRRLLPNERLFHAFTVNEAIAHVREARFPHAKVTQTPQGWSIVEPEPFSFDAIFLDHDCDTNLGPDFHVFARFMVDNPNLFPVKPNVLIHSHNPEGAEFMRDMLDKAGWNVRVCPFKVSK